MINIEIINAIWNTTRVGFYGNPGAINHKYIYQSQVVKINGAAIIVYSVITSGVPVYRKTGLAS